MTPWSGFECDLLVIPTFCEPSFDLPEEVKGQSLEPKQLEARSAVYCLRTQRHEPAPLSQCSPPITFRACEKWFSDSIKYRTLDLWNVYHTVRAFTSFLSVEEMHLEAFFLLGMPKCQYHSCLINLLQLLLHKRTGWKNWALKVLAATQELTKSIKTGCLDILIKTFCSKCPRSFLKIYF